MEKRQINITSHSGSDIFTLIVPEDNSARSAELLSGQYPNSKVMTFYDTDIDETIHGILILNEGETKDECKNRRIEG